MCRPMNIITDERCLKYHQPGHPERPQRVSGTLEFLRKQKDLKIDWLPPLEVKDDEAIKRAHDLCHKILPVSRAKQNTSPHLLVTNT